MLMEDAEDPSHPIDTLPGEQPNHDSVQDSSEGQQGLGLPDSDDEEQQRIIDEDADYDSLVTNLNNEFDIVEENDSALAVDRIIT